jgi:hypothetical protein
MGTSTKLLMVALQANGNEIKTHFFPFCAEPLALIVCLSRYRIVCDGVHTTCRPCGKYGIPLSIRTC